MILGITMGDSSGVGPEILLRSFAAGQIQHPSIVFGDLDVLRFCNEKLACGVSLAPHKLSDPLPAHALPVIDHALLTRDQLRIGEVSAASGNAARHYVINAAKAALAGSISAIVTLPMNKEATQKSDPSFIGHTELIGGLCNAPDVTIMLASDQLIVTHVSTHVSLRRAIEMVKKDRICSILELTCEAVARLRPNPRIAVAGLNPHAGENGLFGDEEQREIIPAVAWARARGLPVQGPFPPDTLFHQAVRKNKFDAIVCMYHDQGHVPLKLLDFEAGVNITLGLPIIRTSVDHGTAFDIAWQGIAGTANFVSAVEYAARLAAGGPLHPST
jgi:4-hydroxythreonine-4-phosphate dehydrogenase